MRIVMFSFIALVSVSSWPQVMLGRQEQITAKMEAVKLQQKESLKRREELISELELVSQLTHREAKEKEVERETVRRDLEAQVLQMTLIVILLLV